MVQVTFAAGYVRNEMWFQMERGASACESILWVYKYTYHSFAVIVVDAILRSESFHSCDSVHYIKGSVSHKIDSCW